MRPYRPSNQVSSGSLVLLLIVSVVGGAVIGGILWAVEHFTSLYLVIAFPILAGAIVGGLLSTVVRSGKVRNPAVVMVFSLLAGLVIYGVYHFATYYVSFRGQVRDAIVENSGETVSDSDLDAFINEVLQEEVGDTGIMGYLRLTAEEGFSITRTTASTSSSGIEIKNEFAWIYWGAEILMAAAVALFMGRQAAMQPFDENTGEWYQPPVLIGVAPGKTRKPLVQALKAGDYHEAGSLLTDADTRYPRLELATRRSPDPAAQDIMMIVNLVQRKNRPTEIARGLMNPGEIDMLLRSASSAAANRKLSL